MWQSMTGYGRGEARAGEIPGTAEIRTVNHRFLDLHVRCPSKYMGWEVRVRSLLRESLARGKVDLFLAVRDWGKAGASVQVNRELLRRFLDAAGGIRGAHRKGRTTRRRTGRSRRRRCGERSACFSKRGGSKGNGCVP